MLLGNSDGLGSQLVLFFFLRLHMRCLAFGSHTHSHFRFCSRHIKSWSFFSFRYFFCFRQIRFLRFSVSISLSMRTALIKGKNWKLPQYNPSFKHRVRSSNHRARSFNDILHRLLYLTITPKWKNR